MVNVHFTRTRKVGRKTKLSTLEMYLCCVLRNFLKYIYEFEHKGDVSPKDKCLSSRDTYVIHPCALSVATVVTWNFIIFRRVQNIAKRLLLAPSCLSVCPSPRMEVLCCHWTDFLEIWCLIIFRKSVEKIEVSLQSYKNNGYFTWRQIYIFDHIPLISP